MRTISKLVLSVSCFALLGAASVAQASVYEWQSADGRVSATFPDRWARVHNQSPSDLLTIKAPGSNDHATCRISAVSDERFKIYPRRYAGHIQVTYLNENIWGDYFNQYDQVVYHNSKNNSGLGEGFATMASVSFETVTGPKMMKRGLAFAALYNNKVYTAECSAQENVYNKWHNPFLSFVKSLDLKRITNFRTEGYYDRSVFDGTYKIKGPTLLDDTYH